MKPSFIQPMAAKVVDRLPEGGDWILNGQKIWSTGAQYCDWGMIVARTDGNAVKHAGLTCFIVDMKAPGIEVRPIEMCSADERG